MPMGRAFKSGLSSVNTLLLGAIAAVVLLFFGLCGGPVSAQTASETRAASDIEVFPGTAPLTWEDDLADRLVSGVDRFLLRQWDESQEQRRKDWSGFLQAGGADPTASAAGLAKLRAELMAALGMPESPEGPLRFTAVSQLGIAGSSDGLIAESADWRARYVRWPAFGGVEAEGILLEPMGQPVRGQVVAVGDADIAAEDWAWRDESFGRIPARLASEGVRVLVPVILSRTMAKRNGRANLSHREYVYRPNFSLGRHLVGLEARQLITGAACLEQLDGKLPIGIVGYGEGGQAALMASALDDRFQTTWIAGYFSSHEQLWDDPIDRNIWRRWARFGDAELAAMVLPRGLVIEACRGPEVVLPGEGGAPASLESPTVESVAEEFQVAKGYAGLVGAESKLTLIAGEDGESAVGSVAAVEAFADQLGLRIQSRGAASVTEISEVLDDPEVRQQRVVSEWIRYSQEELADSAEVRRQYFGKLDTSSVDAFNKTIEPYRDAFRHDVIGHFDLPMLEFNPRTRRAYEGENWVGYDVVLDVFPDVIASGILLWPNGIKPGEKRPVVVCQHGLEGRPQDTMQGDHRAYHDFAARLADQGYIVFSPQNLYLFQDRFRTLQRKANPLGKTLFSVIVPQHQQLTDWLASMPQVDAERIAFYGLSYGGKSAMRIPPLVDHYCLSICSADFNEWVWKNASTRAPHSYVWTGEYEIFEFNLGRTFNYAEMAALIAPRPFMVERGHFDGVAPDETVAYEFAKVRNLYEARLGLEDRCELEWFVGPHTINGVGTFEFLSRHLRWPEDEQE